MSAPRAAHIAAASLNQTVGDWAGNADRIIAALTEAKQRGARMLLLPELNLSGYSLGDRVLRRGTLEHSWRALESVLPHTEGIITFLGLPIRFRGVLYNAIAVVANQEICGFIAKENLATGDVEYENRWYSGWPRGQSDRFEAPNGKHYPIGSLLFEANGLGKFAVEVCEDAWKGMRPASVAALAGATIVVNASASWFVLGKQAMRRRMITQNSEEDLSVYAFSSLVGCDDTRLIFDGSLLIAVDGQILNEGQRFRFSEDVQVIDQVVDIESLARKRMVTGSWRQQVEALHRGDFGPLPELVTISGDFSTPSSAPAPTPYWLRGTTVRPADPSLLWLRADGVIGQDLLETDIPHLELELALCLAMREYLRKTGIPCVALALSGGRDSTMCALILHRMLRYENPSLSVAELKALTAQKFVTVWMETENSSAYTRNAAQLVADEIGSKHLATSIQSAFDLHLQLTEKLTGTALSWSNPAHDLPLQNVQARLRGSLVWMVANLHNALLLTTSNLSEAAVGYATMDGDTAGGLAPIANVPKSLVGLWLQWAARFHGLASVQSVFKAPATAELRPLEQAQTDEDDLMPFFILDQLMFLFVQKGQDPVEMFDTLWPSLQAHYGGDPKAFVAHIRTFVKRMCAAQWKRERFAISFRVTAFDLDPKTGFRFPPVQAPFTAELKELDERVASL